MKHIEKIVLYVAAIGLLFSLFVELAGMQRSDISSNDRVALSLAVIFLWLTMLILYFSVTSRKSLEKKVAWLSVYVAFILTFSPASKYQVVNYISLVAAFAFVVNAFRILKSDERERKK